MTSLDETLNEELTPAEQAKQMGLVYGGFGGWVDSNRKVVARTIDGKLVKVDDDAPSTEKNLGSLIVLSFPADLMYAERHNIPKAVVDKFVVLLKTALKFEGVFVIFTPRNGEKDVAKFLKGVGITANVKLVPFGSSDANKKREYVEKKIKAGFRHVEFFDQDRKAVAAVESLKAPFNKLDLDFKTHLIPMLKVSNGATQKQSDSGEQDKEKAA